MPWCASTSRNIIPGRKVFHKNRSPPDRDLSSRKNLASHRNTERRMTTRIEFHRPQKPSSHWHRDVGYSCPALSSEILSGHPPFVRRFLQRVFQPERCHRGLHGARLDF